MSEIKFTKNELRNQQVRLGQLQKYLPTLQLKKAMLQAQANEVRAEIHELQTIFSKREEYVRHFSSLFLERVGVDPEEIAHVVNVQKRYENIAGVEIPYFEGATFNNITYNLFETPPWLDSAFRGIREMMESKIKVEIAEEKKRAIEKELREVSIRVNLFEKNLIPRALINIKKIKVFLGDQQLAAVSRAKVAKAKIEAKKHAKDLADKEAL